MIQVRGLCKRFADTLAVDKLTVDVRPDRGRSRRFRVRTTASFVNVLRSEWIKLASARSTGWSLLIVFVVSVGFGALSSNSANGSWPKMDAEARGSFDPVGTSLSGLEMAQLAMVILGALVITGEYSSGSVGAYVTQRRDA